MAKKYRFDVSLNGQFDVEVPDDEVEAFEELLASGDQIEDMDLPQKTGVNFENALQEQMATFEAEISDIYEEG